MSEVTVKAMQPILGLDDGAVVTVERTPRVDAAISTGRLRVLDEPSEPLTAVNDSIAAASTAADEPDPESPRTKRVKKLAGIDKDD